MCGVLILVDEIPSYRNYGYYYYSAFCWASAIHAQECSQVLETTLQRAENFFPFFALLPAFLATTLESSEQTSIQKARDCWTPWGSEQTNIQRARGGWTPWGSSRQTSREPVADDHLKAPSRQTSREPVAAKHLEAPSRQTSREPVTAEHPKTPSRKKIEKARGGWTP